MTTKRATSQVSLWICLLVATVNIVSHGCVQGFMDRSKYPPKPRGTIKTIEDPEAGELIDCIDIYKQPAFDDPLMKDIQLKPSSNVIHAFNQTNGHTPKKLFQSWHKYGKCPKGTIPISRTWNNITFPRKSPNEDPSKHQYATAISDKGIYQGASAAFNVWNPRVQIGTNEFSLVQMWLVTDDGPELNTLEVGLMVYPNRYGDSETHLFTFWTRDNYQKTRCYNYQCNGFVQISKEFPIGIAFKPTSEYGGKQYEALIGIAKDKVTGNWWLKLQNKEVGYFRKEVFTNLNNGAKQVHFGGEIINEGVEDRHTSTEMGSGHFAEEGDGKAAYVRNIEVIDSSLGPVKTKLSPHMTNYYCYNIIIDRRPGTEYKSYFYYGGSGYSHMCLY